MIKQITGGICAAKGYRAAGIHCGVHKNRSKSDLGIIVSDVPATAAAVYTTNKVKAGPIYVTRENLTSGTAQAVIVNSGNANACAPQAVENAHRMAESLANELNISPQEVAVASTGVIGQELNIRAIEEGVPEAVKALSYDGSDGIAQAILTTDLRKKEIAVSCEIGGKTVTIGGIAKGSGMIHPNMGTMLAFLTSDCAITIEPLQEILGDAVKRTFNRVSIDGDTSTNDTCLLLANGLAENPSITGPGEAYDTFVAALLEVMTYLAREIARDGEGAKHLITCTVRNGADEEVCEKMAKSVIASSLVKTAICGGDANWGRIICAMGYAGVAFDPSKVDIRLRSAAGEVLVCVNGTGEAFDEALAAIILAEEEITIDADLKDGITSVTAWGCDLTKEYVAINGDYRT